MNENAGPSSRKRQLLEGGSDSDGSDAVQDPDSTARTRNDWLLFWDAMDQKASANRALLWNLMDILAIPKFQEVFKLGFKEVVGLDWNDSYFCGKNLQKKFDSNPKSKFDKVFYPDQRSLILKGKILEWDVTLLRAAIQALIDASNSKWNPTNMAEIVALKNLRNTLSHKGAHHFKDDEFEPMYEMFKNNLKALGWTAEEVDAARKEVRILRNVFKFEAPKKLFYGREDKLRECKEAIRLCKLEENAKDRIVAIHGFGGMGKTQLARSLGQILRSDTAIESELSFDVIFWFDAQTEGLLAKDFKRLAECLGISNKLSKSEKLTDDIFPIYDHLVRYYKQKVLFIFDNAEQLKAQNGKFGVETYLDDNCQGPVFLVTSRDPWHLWIHPSKCIKVDELTPEDARSCLLGYMRIPEEERESEDLKKPFESLVKLIGGHPLGLQLCGSAIETNARRSKENRHSWANVVKDYLNLLSQIPLHDLSDEVKYKEQVRTICQDTLGKIRNQRQGISATALLGIIAYLSPDNMKLGLVKCIHLYKSPDDDCLFLASWEDLPLDMGTEMNILRDYSLIDLHVDTSSRRKCFVLVKIHRLVQECTRELIQSDPELIQERDPLQTIIAFSDRYDLAERYIVFILSLYATNPSELSPLDEESKWKLRSRIAANRNYLEELNPALEDLARNDEEKAVAKLLLLSSEWNREDSEYYSELYGLIRNLCFDYCYNSRAWFIESCSILLHSTIHWNSIPHPQNDKKKKLLEMSGWVLTGYLRCEIIRDMSFLLLPVAHFVIANGGSIEPTLLPKIFSKSTMIDFWEYYDFAGFENSGEWLACLISCPETNLFTASLQSLEESELISDFVSSWGRWFCVALNDAAREPQLRYRLSKDKARFVPSFWKMTEWILGCVPPDKTEEKIIPLILSAWCGLFSGDDSLYELYRLLLDNTVAVWLEQSTDIRFYSYLDYKSLKVFASCKHCSAETKRWIDEVCRLAKCWPLESESEESDSPVTIMENDRFFNRGQQDFLAQLDRWLAGITFPYGYSK